MFKSNVFTANFYTGGKGLLHFEGAPRLFFDGDKFKNNGDNTLEALTTYGSGVLTASATEVNIATVLANPGTHPGSRLGQSLISVKRSYAFSYTNLEFETNWLIETDYSERAQLMYFDQVFGYFTHGALKVLSHKGLNNNFVTTTLSGDVSALSTLA